VFTAYGGIGREGEHFVKQLCEKISLKKGIDKSIVTNYVRSHLSFALLRASLLCLRGTRTIRKMTIETDDIELHEIKKIKN